MAVEEILKRISSNASQSDPGALEHLAATLEMTAAKSDHTGPALH